MTESERDALALCMSLTDREIVALELVSRPGGSRKKAAAALGVSRKTVDHHLASVFAKLGVDNVAAASRLLGRAEWHVAITPLPEDPGTTPP